MRTQALHNQESRRSPDTNETVFTDEEQSDSSSGYKWNCHIRGYMVCNMVCLVHLIRDHKTITVMVPYSIAAYHHLGNALNY